MWTMAKHNVALAVFVLAFGATWVHESEAKDPQKLALLVGCSDYPANQDWQLVGASNDVVTFEKLLRERFSFRDIETLYGWPKDESRRPTLSNIKRSFETLIAKAEPGCQVFILLSGHGRQVAIPPEQTDWLDPTNPEPDGKDEVFLAADSDGADQFVRDDEIGKWMDVLVQTKKCSVWIIFDSCFSGTMSRGSETLEVEYPRTIKLPKSHDLSQSSSPVVETLGKKDAQLRYYSQLLERYSRDAKAVPNDVESRGSLVAFYAAQEFEPAVEVIRPKGAAENDPANRHGLLSFHIQQVLNEQPTGLTYAQLGRVISTKYRSEGRRKPTPLYEGNLEQNVFGDTTWPGARDLVLGKNGKDEWQLEAGVLHGVGPGDVYDVFAPDDTARKQPLARIKTIDVGGESSTVEFLSPSAETSIAVASSARCKLVSQGLNVKKLSVKVVSVFPKWTKKEHEITDELVKLSEVPGAVFNLKEADQPADWIVLIGVNGKGVGSESVVCLGNSVDLSDVTNVPERAPLAAYGVEVESSRIAKEICADLQKVFSWLSLWEIVGIYSEPSPFVESEDVKIVVERDIVSDAAGIHTSKVKPGEQLSIKVVNSSVNAYWYSALYLNGRYGIDVIRSGGIPGRDGQQSLVERTIAKPRIGKDSIGSNALVVLSLSQREHPSQPDYRFLTQGNIGDAGTRVSADMSQLKSPFEQLLVETQQCRGSVRGVQCSESPQFSVWTWTAESD